MQFNLPASWASYTIEDWRNIALICSAAFGIPFLIWRTIIAQVQASIATRAHNMDRFQKGAAMLGDDRLSVRQAGVIFLKDLALSKPSRHGVACMEALQNFIQDRCGEMERAEEEGPDDSFLGSGSDAQYALETLAIISHKTKRGVRIRNTHFRGASFDGMVFRNADFELCTFDMCEFINSHFINSNFEQTHFDQSNLTNTRFSRCNLQVSTFAKVDNANGTFQKCNLTASILKPPSVLDDASMIDCIGLEAQIHPVQQTYTSAGEVI